MSQKRAAIRSVLARMRVASPLTTTLRGMVQGLVGDPTVNGYKVTSRGIVVDLSASVLLPPSEVAKTVKSAPPKDALAILSADPTLMADASLESTVAALPFDKLPDNQFKTLVKKMGGLSQYSDAVLIALLEGREPSFPDPDTGLPKLTMNFAKRYIKRPSEAADPEFYVRQPIKNGVLNGMASNHVDGSGTVGPLTVGPYPVATLTVMQRGKYKSRRPPGKGTSWLDEGGFWLLEKGTVDLPDTEVAAYISQPYKVKLTSLPRSAIEALVEEAAQ